MFWVIGATWLDIYLYMGDMVYGSGIEMEFQFNFFGMYDSIFCNMVCWFIMGNYEGKFFDLDM